MPPESIADVSRRVVAKQDVQERLEKGRVVLVKRRFGPLRRRLLRLLGLEPDLTVRLDELGTAVWLAIDGKRTVAQIGELLQAKFPGQEDINARLGKFLGSMVSRDLVTLG